MKAELSRSTPVRPLRAIDFFCGAGGMTNGFQKAGIQVLAGIDIDPDCEATYIANNPKAKFILSNIRELSFRELQQLTHIKKNDPELIFIGCSPCQYWSKISTNRTKSEESKNLLKDFQKFVHHFKPGYVVIENVPGILNRMQESPLKKFLKFLQNEGYDFKHDVINASHFGVPQTRKRFLLIASNQTQEIDFPEANKTEAPTVRKFIGSAKVFKRITAGHIDNTDFMHTSCNLAQQNVERLKLTPKDGGNRLSWRGTKLQIPTYKNRDDSFTDVYGRMFWDKPAPTITTKFYSISNGRFAHPSQDRAISLREGATLQTFDLKYKFKVSSILTAARLIGNAVPPQLAKKIGESLVRTHKTRE